MSGNRSAYNPLLPADKPVNVYTLDGKLVGSYKSLSYALRKLGLSSFSSVVDANNKNGKPRTTLSKLLKERVYLRSIKPKPES
jgi:hypothetical protein